MTWPPEIGVFVGGFTVYGRARPAGSKRSFVPRKGDGTMVTRPDGQPMVVTKDDSGDVGDAWRQDVAARGVELRPESGVYECPLALELTFYLMRPKSHYGTGRNAHLLKGGAPAYPTGKPDTGKLSRAVHDALTSVLYRDDAVIVETRERKVYGDPERCEVCLWRLPEVVAAANTAQLGMV